MQRQLGGGSVPRITVGFLPGSTSVRCPSCNLIDATHPGMSLSHTRCRSCRSFLPFGNGSGSVRCPRCSTLQQQPGRFGRIICGGCQTTLMYLLGARGVKCARCLHVTSAPIMTNRGTSQVNRSNLMIVSSETTAVSSCLTSVSGTATSDTASSSSSSSSSSTPKHCPPTGAILVENPMSVDVDGKLMRNIAVGVRMDKK